MIDLVGDQPGPIHTELDARSGGEGPSRAHRRNSGTGDASQFPPVLA
jgi:hypothetical protein